VVEKNYLVYLIATAKQTFVYTTQFELALRMFVSGINELPTRRRKESDNVIDRENGLRMKNESRIKEKDLVFC
jgi:hypothetical protein